MAAVGSASLIFSLWQPWYDFRVPGLIIQQAEQAAHGVAVALYRLIKIPGTSGMLAPGWGLELALGSAVAVLAGGLFAVADDKHVPDGYVPAPITLTGDADAGTWPTPPSVAPPSP